MMFHKDEKGAIGTTNKSGLELVYPLFNDLKVSPASQTPKSADNIPVSMDTTSHCSDALNRSVTLNSAISPPANSLSGISIDQDANSRKTIPTSQAPSANSHLTAPNSFLFMKERLTKFFQGGNRLQRLEVDVKDREVENASSDNDNDKDSQDDARSIQSKKSFLSFKSFRSKIDEGKGFSKDEKIYPASPSMLLFDISGFSEELVTTKIDHNSYECYRKLIRLKMEDFFLSNLWDVWDSSTNALPKARIVPKSSGVDNFGIPFFRSKGRGMRRIGVIQTNKELREFLINCKIIADNNESKIHIFKPGIKPKINDPNNKDYGCICFKVPQHDLTDLKFWQVLLSSAINDDEYQNLIDNINGFTWQKASGVSGSLFKIWISKKQDTADDSYVKNVYRTVKEIFKTDEELKEVVTHCKFVINATQEKFDVNLSIIK